MLAMAFAGMILATAANGNGNESMDPEIQEIENVRNAHESQIMAIDGVVMIATGLSKDGKPCLKIGTSVSPEKIRDKLPAAIFSVCVEIENVGEIKAQ